MSVPTLTEYPTAEATPQAWWSDHPDDPRHTRAWASAIRWRGDGVSFVGRSATGPFATVRRGPATGGWSRTNAVEVCAGTFRGADPPGRALDAARTHRPRQLVAAASGYTCPVFPGGGFDPETAAVLLTELEQVARGESSTFGVLHTPAGAPLVPVLRELGFRTGVTDLYAYVTVDTDDPTEYVAGQPHRRRHRMRRELYAFARRGGRLDIRAGESARPYLPVVAELEARASRARGGPMTPQMAAEVNDGIFAEFGSHAMAVLVRDGDDEVVASTGHAASGVPGPWRGRPRRAPPPSRPACRRRSRRRTAAAAATGPAREPRRRRTAPRWRRTSRRPPRSPAPAARGRLRPPDPAGAPPLPKWGDWPLGKVDLRRYRRG